METLGGACVASNDLKVKRLRQESQRTLVREANQSHACYARFDSPVPAEHKGESHATNARTGVRAGPQRRTDSVASAV
jgi:hypothetical protein